MDELGGINLIRFSDGSLILTMVFRESGQFPVHPESTIG